MPTDEKILERIITTAEAKKQRWDILVHALQQDEFEALCRAGAEPIDQWKDGAVGSLLRPPICPQITQITRTRTLLGRGTSK